MIQIIMKVYAGQGEKKNGAGKDAVRRRCDRKRTEGMDKLKKREYTLIRIEERCAVMSELYRKMQDFLGDQQRLMERMAGRLDLWEECVGLFPREEILDEMDAALQAGDTNALYGAVHRLKGNLANFGFDSAAELAMKVLSALKENEPEKVKEGYLQLRTIYAQIAERLGDAE